MTEMFPLLRFKQDVCHHSSILGHAYLEDLESLERPRERGHSVSQAAVAGNHRDTPPPPDHDPRRPPLYRDKLQPCAVSRSTRGK